MGATEPRVLCVMLTRDRHELAKRAVECFRQQTYDPCKRFLAILDTGDSSWFDARSDSENEMHFRWETKGSIGWLRNEANTSFPSVDIIAHFDDDDWSHPNRLTEQVALLQASGADAVGYNEMLFWRNQLWDGGPGDAWLYSNPRPNYALGTSLCYWRKAWERSPFTDGPKPEGTSEYHHWFKQGGVTVASKSSFGGSEGEPRMVARIHGKNFGAYDIEKQIASGSREWKRVPAWDARVREILS
jgi:hypothetical protein